MDGLLGRLGLADSGWLDPAVTCAFFLLTLLGAAIFHKLLFPLILRFTQKTSSDLEVWPESHWPGFALRQTDVL